MDMLRILLGLCLAMPATAQGQDEDEPPLAIPAGADSPDGPREPRRPAHIGLRPLTSHDEWIVRWA